MSKLEIRDLCKEFSTPAETLQVLQDVHLELTAGDDVSIVGPSGCGKSTLLYILGTLDEPSRGSVELDGTNPFELPPKQLAAFRNSKIGFVFQDHHLLPQLSVTENVLLPALAKGTPTKAEMERARALIDSVGLEERHTHLPAQLSGGERQRVAVARALLNEPVVLLADEPTGNLDQENTEKIAELLFALPRQHHAMLVVVTHSQLVAERATRQMQLRDHRLLEK